MREHSEGSITSLLRTKYSGKSWAFVSQVPNGTGMAKTRTCDGLAMCLWPSKGLHLHGFEIKVSRSDWLTEIQDPSKAFAFARYCHYWWIVVPKGIVRPEECAVEWGIQEVTSHGNLRVKRPASLMEPESVDTPFLAGLFQATCRKGADREISAAYRRGEQEAMKGMLSRLDEVREQERERNDERVQRLVKSIDDFEVASGIKIKEYNGGHLGRQVAAAIATENVSKMLHRIRQQAAQVVSVLDTYEAEAEKDGD